MASDILELEKIKYLDLTHKLNDYNEIYNLNTYLDGTNTTELDKLSYTNETLKTRILKLKQEYLAQESDVKLYTFRNNILYFSTIVIAFILCIVAFYSEGSFSGKFTVIIILCILTVYFFILLLLIKANVERRTYAYDQYYWAQVKKQT
jgi:cytochrome c-type biogenesis protein CcmH/NrfG